MSGITDGGANASRGGRLANWDLLRSLSMFLVVVVHCGAYPCYVGSVNLGGALGRAAIVCDPVFFVLSGYFAIRPLKTNLRSYFHRKLVTIVLPLFAYSIILYMWSTHLSGVSLARYLVFFAGMMGPWWFIPCLIPFLILAPFLYRLFEALDDAWLKRLSVMVLATSVWSCLVNLLGWAPLVANRPGLSALVDMASRLIPTHLVPTGYFVFFCAGYFLRRLSPLLSKREKRALKAIGIAFWGADVLTNHFGVPVADPSDYWFMAAAALFIIFDDVRIASDSALGKVLCWTGERSYSIYLLQATVIGVIGSAFYTDAVFGDISGMVWYVRLLAWASFAVVSYGVSLLLASVFDVVALEPVQKGFEFALRRINAR